MTNPRDQLVEAMAAVDKAGKQEEKEDPSRVAEETKKPPPPSTFQLENEDRLRLIASEATLGKVVADVNCGRLQMNILTRNIQDSERVISELGTRHQELMAELSAKYRIPSMGLYAVDYETGKGELRTPGSRQQPPAPFVSRR